MNKKGSKDLILMGVIVISVLIVVGFKFLGGGSSEGTMNVNAGDITGKIVAMDPNRAMAGSPCHVMGGRIMGDCTTREVNLEAWRYDWSEPTITVKTGELVRIIATSRDVAHGIGIPDVGFNLRINPGETTVGEFIAPAPGEYSYGCTVMCGPGHMDHKGKLVVVA